MHVYTRAEWGARPARKPHPHTVTSTGIVFIHHSAGLGAAIDTLSEQKAAIRQIQRYHQDTHGWDDIGYSYVVFQPQGRMTRARAFEARGFEQVPAAQEGHNAGNGAICIVGNFDVEGVKRNTRYCVEQVARRFPGMYLSGHRDVNQTSCPGDHLYADLDRIAKAAGKKRAK